ncbi:hypothetical protein DER29_1176 [Micromonospora sp. M71_S20]|nr:hypothetical protein DER29_1176 [Micromonospora sp. M71_S20]
MRMAARIPAFPPANLMITGVGWGEGVGVGVGEGVGEGVGVGSGGEDR